jgi:hypothetical protein
VPSTRLRSAGGLLALLLCTSGPARAHPTPGSVAFVDFTVDGARLEQDVPVEELERALKRPLAQPGESAERIVARHAELLRSYAGLHVRARSRESRRPWQGSADSVTGHDASDGPRARFLLTLRAPAGEASRSLNLHDDIVAHEVVSHYTTVYVRSDWASGVVLDRPRLVGTIHAGRNDVAIARDGSFLRGFRSIVALGAEHITTGTDHLIFLFALVLVAPLAAQSGRWQPRPETRPTLLALARVVTAFTIGHSLTLALGALGGVTLPSAPVEAGIALSILVTALHALRPLFPRREALLAGAFGLVHGLAFASSLARRELGTTQAAWTLLGFNLGIELAQLLLLALVLPWLLLLARTRAYAQLRVSGGVIASALACAWLAERTLGVANPMAAPVGWIEAHPVVLLGALAAYTMIASALERRARAQLESARSNESNTHPAATP